MSTPPLICHVLFEWPLWQLKEFLFLYKAVIKIFSFAVFYTSFDALILKLNLIS
jgi:hypothetical protein